jgi:hypothetical protein
MKTKTLMIIITLIVVPSVAMAAAYGFIQPGSISSTNPPGFFCGIWHGMIAPYSLIIKLFTEVYMYAVPNKGWTYDLGFIIGLCLALHLGWLAALISLMLLLLS